MNLDSTRGPAIAPEGQPPAPAEHPAAGAGLPARAYDALHALADREDADRRGHETAARRCREVGDAVQEALADGRTRQLADDARDVRNLANDLLNQTTEET